MGRGQKQVEGQISFNFCLEPSNYVVQSNELINGKQALKLNSAKLIRAAIMQVVKEDAELKPYIVTIKELADLLNVPKSNIYRDIECIVQDILNHPVSFKRTDGKKEQWVKIPWYTRCEYHSDIGVALKLNPELEPYLINLKAHYTQYSLGEILAMKSVYAIRIFELIQSRIMSRAVPIEGTHVVMSVQEIRECCDCEKKYPAFGNFKDKVLDAAAKEINRVTIYDVSYTYQKEGKKVTAIDFFIISKYSKKAIKE